MSNLDRIYDLNLDIVHKVKNDKMEFSLSDVDTSMFYVTFMRNKKVLDLKGNLITFYMVKPNNIITHIDLQYDSVEERFYCDLTGDCKDIKGNYVGQIIINDSSTGKRIVVPSIISYAVVTDILENISNGEDEGNDEEQLAILENLIKEVSLLKTKVTENSNEISKIKTNYATKEYVSNTIKDIDVTDKLKDYVTETELENKKYATENYVDKAIENSDGGSLKARVDANESNINKILEVVDEPPTYTSPTLTLSLSKSTLEHNISTSLSITPSYAKNDAGSTKSYVLKKDGTTIYTDTSPKAYTDTVTISHGNSLEYQAVTTYEDGEIKTTTFGIEYPSTSIKAGQVSAKKTITSYAKTYYGVISGNTITSTDVSKLTSKSNTSKSNTITYNLTGQRSVLMYPKSFGTLTSIKDSNNFDYINSYNRSELTYDGVTYYVYILIDPVTITGFKQTFN